jgi:hypothetical protein
MIGLIVILIMFLLGATLAIRHVTRGDDVLHGNFITRTDTKPRSHDP